jgi:hypothetical protein
VALGRDSFDAAAQKSLLTAPTFRLAEGTSTGVFAVPAGWPT